MPMESDLPSNAPFRQIPPPKDVDPPRQRIDVAVTAPRPFFSPTRADSETVSKMSETENQMFRME